MVEGVAFWEVYRRAVGNAGVRSWAFLTFCWFLYFALLCFALPLPLRVVVGLSNGEQGETEIDARGIRRGRLRVDTLRAAPLAVILDANMFSPCCTCFIVNLQVNVMNVGQPVRW